MIEQVHKARKTILEGGTILYPTDTIWGVGCLASDPDAVERIFQIKERPDKKSMLVLVDGIDMLNQYVVHVPDLAKKIIHSSHKPTTIIYPGARNFADNLIGEDGTIGIRITADPFCCQLIKSIGKPIVSTSANISGQPSPGSFKDISPDIRNKVDYIVQWRQKDTTASIPSSIIKIDAQDQMTIIRS